MLNIVKEKLDGCVVINLEGDATIEHISKLHQTLLDELKSHACLLINCDSVDKIDFYTLQLLCSAHRTSFVRHSTLNFQGEISELVKKTMVKTGFVKDYGCHLCPPDVKCLWAKYKGPGRRS